MLLCLVFFLPESARGPRHLVTRPGPLPLPLPGGGSDGNVCNVLRGLEYFLAISGAQRPSCAGTRVTCAWRGLCQSACMSRGRWRRCSMSLGEAPVTVTHGPREARLRPCLPALFSFFHFFLPTSNAPIPANSQCSRGNAYPAWCVPIVTHGRTPLMSSFAKQKIERHSSVVQSLTKRAHLHHAVFGPMPWIVKSMTAGDLPGTAVLRRLRAPMHHAESCSPCNT